jgi:biopolymer transport protein TolR
MPSMISRHGSGRGRRTINEINMVPFIDVMLVLLIIFMVTAPLISPSTINLPSMGSATQQTEAVIQVLVATDGKLQIVSGGTTQAVELSALGGLIKTAQSASQTPTSKGSPVVISADKSVKYESVVQVMDQLQRSGVQRVGLSVQVGGK